MGRQKKTPKKLQNNDSGLSFDITGDFRPVIKNSKTRKKRSVPDPFVHHAVLLPNTEETQRYFLGELPFGYTNNVVPSDYSECKVSFSKLTWNQDEGDSNSLILRCDDSINVVQPLLLDIDFIKQLISTKTFAIKFKMSNDEVISEIYFVTLPLTKFNARTAKIVKTIFQYIFDITPFTEDKPAYLSDKEMHSNREIAELYRDLLNIRKTPEVTTKNLQHRQLKPTLRPYQADAVKWILHKETTIETEIDNLQHPMFIPVTLKSGVVIYYDRYSGYIQETKPLVQPSSKGGILADEMGLGKTVEVLACILLNKGVKTNETNSENQNEMSPIIEKQPKKRKMPDEGNYDHSSSFKRSRNKTTTAWVTTSRSAKFISLQKAYLSTLDKYCTTKPLYIPDIIKVQCICGSTNEDDTIDCESCGKYQHKSCLGYKKRYGRYLCPKCWMTEPPFDVGATLIVTPLSLRSQWCKEICKHIRGDFKVLSYQGNSVTPVYPTQLKEYDVVITTYNVLQSELPLTEMTQEKYLRNQRKYSQTRSALIRVVWWRLCLDEAQTVDAPTKMVSEMANKINAKLRWAVTGTPISKNISDIYGLVDYLQIAPYNDLETWKHKLYNPYVNGDVNPMYKFLSRVLWRTSKEHVLDQMGVPKQTFHEHLLEFSAVEKYFYRREHELCRISFQHIVEKYNLDWLLECLDRSTLNKILSPLYTLRQACSHPNTIRGKYLATKKKVTSMKDLLDALILKNTSDSEESLRLVISALNGLAGIYLLLQAPQEAIEKYREVLQLSTRFSDEHSKENTKLTVDKLQQIHAMHNLADVLEVFPPLHPTLRDDTLRDDCQKLEQLYIEKFMKETFTVYESSSTCVMLTRSLQEKFELQPGQWYALGIEWVFSNKFELELYHKIDSAVDINGIASSGIRYRVSEKYLLKIIYEWDTEVFQLRHELLTAVDSLYDQSGDNCYKITIKNELVAKAMDCHLRPQNKSKANKGKCLVCQANNRLKSYEGKLFRMTKRRAAFEDMSLVGSWKPTVEELIFKSLLSLLKTRNADRIMIQDAETHISIIEGLKKEFKEVRKLWTYLDRQICAQDEVSICKVRLQLKTDTEIDEDRPKKQSNILKNLTYTEVNRLEHINLLNAHELDYQRTLLHNEHRMNMAKLDSLLGTQSYLETLRKQQYEGESPDPCPICKNALEQHWSILHCGHSYCLECIQVLLEKFHGDFIQCSVCRKRQKVQEISYIKAGNTVTQEDTKSIKGNFSTKIEAVIKLLLELEDKDSEVKVILFSSWESVLKRLKKALEENQISAELALHSKNLEKHIENFKDPSKKIMNLLLPVHLGSKGLNIIEATHVVLIEPLLNPADELQAVGRVHRIGQTKPTFVHKFFIKNTIEESIHHAITSNAESWDKNKLTLRHLTELFVEGVGAASGEVSVEVSVQSNNEVVVGSSYGVLSDSNEGVLGDTNEGDMEGRNEGEGRSIDNFA